jgi:hypothetical protein
LGHFLYDIINVKIRRLMALNQSKKEKAGDGKAISNTQRKGALL